MNICEKWKECGLKDVCLHHTFHSKYGSGSCEKRLKGNWFYDGCLFPDCKCIPVHEVKYIPNKPLDCPFGERTSDGQWIRNVEACFCRRPQFESDRCQYFVKDDKTTQTGFCTHPKEIKEMEYDHSTICQNCHGTYGQHVGNICPFNKTTFGPMEKTKMEYKVIKDFTKADYIVAHQKKYNWSKFSKSCEEFQEDMNKWINERLFLKGIIFSPEDMIYSHNFFAHAVKFGFIKEKEEKFYKIGDRFNIKNSICILAASDSAHCGLIDLSNGNRRKDFIKVNSINCVTENELRQITDYDYELVKD